MFVIFQDKTQNVDTAGHAAHASYSNILSNFPYMFSTFRDATKKGL